MAGFAFSALKGDCETLLREVTGRAVEVSANALPGLHPGKSARVTIDGREAGIIGALDPRLAQANDLGRDAYICLLDVGALPPQQTPHYVPPSKFPSTYRDVALVVGVDVAARDLERAIAVALGPVCTRVRVFDEFRGAAAGRRTKEPGRTRYPAAFRRDDHRPRGRCGGCEAARRGARAFWSRSSNVMGGFVWPDIVILIVLAIATYKGFRRGFVSELGGAVAVTAALVTPWFYNGSLDGQIAALTKLGPGSAHVVGMFATGLLTYIVLLIVARLLGAVAKLPVLGTGNALGGAAVGFAKGAILLWLVLFIALFFPALAGHSRRSSPIALRTVPRCVRLAARRRDTLNDPVVRASVRDAVP